MSKTGDDTTGDGSADSPYLTIGKANAVAAASGQWTHIQVGAGTYQEQVTVPRSHLTYVADGAVVIDGQTTRAGFSSAFANTVIRGFECVNCTAGISLTGPTSEVYDCEIHAGGTGINFGNGSDGGIAEDCEIYNVSGRGVYVYESPGTLCRRIHVHDGDLSGDGECYAMEIESNSDGAAFIRCWALTGFSNGIIVKTSTGGRVEGCVVSGASAYSIYAKGAPNGEAHHNVVYNDNIGIALLDNSGSPPASSGWVLRDNILVGNNEGLRTNGGSSADLDSDYNDFYNNDVVANIEGTSYATLVLYQAGESQDAHSLTTDPAYEDVTYGGFALPTGSALLTAGSEGDAMGIDGSTWDGA